jgi:hypothetical protein
VARRAVIIYARVLINAVFHGVYSEHFGAASVGTLRLSNKSRAKLIGAERERGKEEGGPSKKIFADLVVGTGKKRNKFFSVSERKNWRDIQETSYDHLTIIL